MRSLFTFIAVSVIFSACQKQYKPVPIAPKNKQPGVERFMVPINIVSPENPKNPYDSAGIIHNILLSEVHQYILNTGDTNKVSIQTHVINFYKRSREFDSRNLEKLTPRQQNAVLLQRDQMVLSFDMPPTRKAFITELVSILKNTKGQDYASIKDKIVLLENRIMSNSSLSTMDKRALLSTTSVARYSSNYWLGWAKGDQGQAILSKKFQSQLELNDAMSFAFAADCYAVWVAWWSGWIHWASAEEILAFSSAVSAMAYISIIWS